MYGVFNQMPLKRLQTTDTYILTCHSSSTVSPTHVPPCTVKEKTAAVEQGREMTQSVKPSKQ